jgi:hypothetical protein
VLAGRERRVGPDVQHVPRHPEVDQESSTSLEPDNQILAAAIDGCDALALQLGRDLDWVEGARQPRIGDLDALEGSAHEPRLEPAADGLDLRKLRHRTSVVGGIALDAEGVGVPFPP